MKKILLLSGLLLSCFLTPASHSVRADVFNPEQFASRLIALTNAERETRGLSALSENGDLTQAAFNKANDMLAKGYFSHTTPEGKRFFAWVDNAGYEYTAVAENLAVNLDMNSPEQMVSSWLNSPGHRTNLLSGSYSELGMGVSRGTYQGKAAIFAVHIFAHPKQKSERFNLVTTAHAEVVPEAINEIEPREGAEIPEPQISEANMQKVTEKTLVKNAAASKSPLEGVINSPELTAETTEDSPATALSHNVVDNREITPSRQFSFLQKFIGFFTGFFSKIG